MSIFEQRYGHFVGMEYHSLTTPHIGCPYCKQPPRVNDHDKQPQQGQLAGGIVPSDGIILAGKPGPEAVILPEGAPVVPHPLPPSPLSGVNITTLIDGKAWARHVLAGCQQLEPMPVTPLTTPDDTPDRDARAYLAMAADDVASAVHWLTLAMKGRTDLVEALATQRQALRDVLDALEAEIGGGQP